MYDLEHLSAPNGSIVRAIHCGDQYWYLAPDAPRALGSNPPVASKRDLLGPLSETHIKQLRRGEINATEIGPQWRFMSAEAVYRLFNKSRKPDAHLLAAWIRPALENTDGLDGGAGSAVSYTAGQLRQLAHKLEQMEALRREVDQIRQALGLTEEQPAKPRRERDERDEAFGNLKRLSR